MIHIANAKVILNSQIIYISGLPWCPIGLTENQKISTLYRFLLLLRLSVDRTDNNFPSSK